MTDSDHDQIEPADQELAHRLSDQRPLPGGEFRGELGRRLAAEDPGYGPRPASLRATSAGLLGIGLVVAGLGALTAVGVV
jgi:hypothetical protein